VAHVVTVLDLLQFAERTPGGMLVHIPRLDQVLVANAKESEPEPGTETRPKPSFVKGKKRRVRERWEKKTALKENSGSNFVASGIIQCCKCEFSVSAISGSALTLIQHLDAVHHQRAFVCPACAGAGRFFYSASMLKR